MTMKVPQRLQDLLDQGTQEFLKENSVSQIEKKGQAFSNVDFQWTGIIGFSGDLIKGSLGITCTASLLEKTHPNIAMGMPVTESDCVDWLGEIANQILGRLKNLTLEYGVKFSLSAPNVVKGNALSIVGNEKRMINQVCYLADKNPVLISIVCTFNSEFDFDKAAKVESSKQASEGESLLF